MRPPFDTYTLPKLFLKTVERIPDRPALGWKHGSTWESMPYRELAQKVSQRVQVLQKLDLKVGDRVALLSENRPEWAFMDLAMQCLGLINVPLYFTLSTAQIKVLVEHSGAAVILVSGGELLHKVLSVLGELPGVKKVLHFDALLDPPLGKPVTHLDVLLKDTPAKDLSFLEEVSRSVKPDMCASIVYTSGTTGNPKGVMLSHQNFCSNVDACIEALPLNEQDRVLSFLPLSHVFERTCGYYVILAIGGAIYYAETMEKVADNMGEVHPTAVISVPRLYEKMHAAILEKVEAAGRRPLFDWALAKGKALLDSPAPSPWLKFQYKIAEKLVFSKLKKRTGGKLRFFVSGGAALQKHLGEFFKYAGLDIIEGYGLTESAPVICCNRFGKIKFGSIGLPLFNLEVDIKADGELCVKGPSVMLGYYQNLAATHEVLGADGWLHTGDLAKMDQDGYLWITGRKKQILVLSNGKNISPEPIEAAVASSRFFEQVLLLGDDRNYVVVVAVAAENYLRTRAKEIGVNGSALHDYLSNVTIQNLLLKEVHDICKDFARFEQPKRLLLRSRLFAIEEGTLTPSLKVIRGKVLTLLKSDIEQLYKGDKDVLVADS